MRRVYSLCLCVLVGGGCDEAAPSDEAAESTASTEGPVPITACTSEDFIGEFRGLGSCEDGRDLDGLLTIFAHEDADDGRERLSYTLDALGGEVIGFFESCQFSGNVYLDNGTSRLRVENEIHLFEEGGAEVTITTFDELDGDAVLNACVFFGTRP